jgi:mannose-1-phosphate guanylyltransferase
MEKVVMIDKAWQNDKLWSLVLAGGNGERLKPLIQRWLGRHKPKQYCTFIGTRSMFQHTLDRSDRIIPPERRVTIIAQDHMNEANAQFGSRPRGRFILQPSNRDTAAGIFLGVANVRVHDPEATVLIFPSDHFVHPEERFVEIAHSMAQVAHHMDNWIYLLGAPPDGPEQEYGWIQPGAHIGLFDGCRLRTTRVFLEKPGLAECRAAIGSGSLWNTMVTAAKVDTLWQLGRRCFPEMMGRFDIYCEAIGTGREDLVLEHIYREMPKWNFSAHLLQRLPRHVLVMELRDVLWSDWGNPERIASTLRLLGHEPEACWERMATVNRLLSGPKPLNIQALPLIREMQ